MPSEKEKILRYTACCGVKEMHGVNSLTPKRFCYLVGKSIELEKMMAGIIMFTSNDGEDGKGKILSEYIHANNLGTVTPSGVATNPNTQALIQLYAWVVNHKELYKHYVETLADEYKKYVKYKDVYGELRVGACVNYIGGRVQNEPTSMFNSNYSFDGQAIITGFKSPDLLLLELTKGRQWLFTAQQLNKLKVVYNGQGETLYSNLKYII